jgi:hypothetical protein
MGKISFVKKPATAGTSIKNPEGTEVTSQLSPKVPEKVAPKTAAETPAIPEEEYVRVGLEASYTHNLGDYKSSRGGCWIEVPCAITEIEPVYGWAKSWIEDKMGEIINEMAK